MYSQSSPLRTVTRYKFYTSNTIYNNLWRRQREITIEDTYCIGNSRDHIWLRKGVPEDEECRFVSNASIRLWLFKKKDAYDLKLFVKQIWLTTLDGRYSFIIAGKEEFYFLVLTKLVFQKLFNWRGSYYIIFVFSYLPSVVNLLDQ